MEYLDRVVETCIDANRKSLKYRDAKAWDNRKAKISKRHKPRGKAYKRIVSIESKAEFNRLVDFSEDLKLKLGLR